MEHIYRETYPKNGTKLIQIGIKRGFIFGCGKKLVQNHPQKRNKTVQIERNFFATKGLFVLEQNGTHTPLKPDHNSEEKSPPPPS